jgi:putative transposase
LIIGYRDCDTLICQRAVDGLELDLKANHTSRKPPSKEASPYVPRSQMSPEQEAEMQKRATLLLPFVNEPCRSKLVKVAKDLGLSVPRVYAMLQDFRGNGGDIRAFAGQCPTGGRGKGRLTPEQEAAIAKVIRLKILKRNPKKPKAKVSQIYQILDWICRREQPRIETPAYNSLATRLRALTPQRKAELLKRVKPSRHRHLIAAGEFPEAAFPLQCVLIDNFRVDLVVVDRKYRTEMGRPWLTLAIDAFSRMVVGYYISMDAPSTLSVGLCLITVIKDKAAILQRLGIDAKWSAYGMPVLVHTDNGADFVSEAFRNACRGRGIELMNRPVRNPEMGGLVERWGGTLNGKVWEFPGATFNNPEIRGDYDPEKEASITLDELERIVVRLIVAYHHDVHRGIKCSPESKWEVGLMGNDETPGIGIPEIPSDIDKLYYEILPMEPRTIQKRGIVWDNLWYYSDELHGLLLERDPKDPKKQMSFVMKRDPRSLSQIHLLTPRSDEFITVPWVHNDWRDVNLWDYRSAKAEADRRGLDTQDPDVVFRMNEEIQEQIANSQKLTKNQRRILDRRDSSKPELQNPAPATSEPQARRLADERPKPLAPVDSGPSPYDDVRIL